MDIGELYLYLFFNSLSSNFVLSYGDDLVLYTMLTLGSFNLNYMFLVHGLACFIGGIGSYYVGRCFRLIEKLENSSLNHNSIKSGEKIFYETPLRFILLLCFLPLWGNLIIAIAGVFKYKQFKVFLYILILKFIYSYYLILY